MTDRDRELFRDLSAPTAPPDLGRRAVAAARRAAVRRTPGLDERLWQSWPVRLAWAASVVVLLAANAAVLTGTSRTGAERDRIRVEAPGVVELVAALDLPPATARPAPRRPTLGDSRAIVKTLIAVDDSQT